MVQSTEEVGTESVSRRSRRGGGRSERLRRDQGSTIANPAYITRAVPTYELLREEELIKLEEHADWILKEVGFTITDHPEALDLFRQAGATVVGETVHFDPGLARSLCASAPAKFTLHARNPARDVVFGGPHLVTCPTYGPPMVSDLDRGRRKGSIEDFRNLVRLGQTSPYIHHSGNHICEPEDLPLNKRHLDMIEALITLSDKSFSGSAATPESARDSLDMARIVFGDERLKRDCVIMAADNVNSPLSLDGNSVEVMKVYAGNGQAMMFSPFMMSGAMSPVTPAASIAQVHAELMATIALYQLIGPGAPFIYGSFLTTLDLKTGAPTYGTPEANLSTFATAQLARRLGVPFRCGGMYTNAKLPDAQSMSESITACDAGVMAGANFMMHAAGWLEGGMVTSFEKYVMDLDHIGALHRTLQGLSFDDNQMAYEAYRERQGREVFLGVGHTQRNFATANYRAELADTGPVEHWREAGSLNTAQRANRKWKAMLKAYQQPGIDDAVAQELSAFAAKRKSEMPDRWY